VVVSSQSTPDLASIMRRELKFFNFVNFDLNFMPLFSSLSFVDIMHTNAGFIGIGSPVGHIDVWVNGGRDQPKCALLSFTGDQCNSALGETIASFLNNFQYF
jgi:hypothetical protein